MAEIDKDKVMDKLLTKWEKDDGFKTELRKDPEGVLEGYFEQEGELDPETKAMIADLATKVKNNSDQQLEQIKSKSCGGSRI